MFHEGIIPLIISLVLEIYRSPSFNCFYKNKYVTGLCPVLKKWKGWEVEGGGVKNVVRRKMEYSLVSHA